MAELLLELFSEEMPAKMQKYAQDDLKNLISSKLKAANINYKSLEGYVTPRRLTIYIDGLEKEQAASNEERKGPKVSAADSAINGFLRSTNLTKEQLEIREIDGERVYFAKFIKPAVKTYDLLITIINEAIAALTWPKSMRWGNSKIRWVRPLKNILCLFDDKILPVSFGHLIANNNCFGHRFMGNSFTVESYADYLTKLKNNYVIIDAEDRKKIILEQAKKLADAQQVTLIEDSGLLEEVAGLVEWPVALIGRIDEQFMSIPKEVLISSMRTHQKYFAVEDKNNDFAPYFIVIANINANDNGIAITQGNERVLRARLSDAKFFYEQDLAKTLDNMQPKLSSVVFHTKLGSIAEKLQRMQLLADILPGDKTSLTRAISLSKADLMSEMVGEFPELQGLMGYYYAKKQDESEEVSVAIRDHYKPLGPSDNVPLGDISASLAIADKIVTIVGLFTIGEKPTSSKDPYALRRAALGIIRIILENKITIDIKELIEHTISTHESKQQVTNEILEFFAERLKFMMKAENIRHDVISAVFNLQQNYDLFKITLRAKSIQNFIDSELGKHLFASYKRACNIVDIEEKKDKTIYNDSPNPEYLINAEDHNLYNNLQHVQPLIFQYINSSEYAKAMNALEKLNEPINNFFDKVLVNDNDVNVRRNRLLMLSGVKKLLESIANFSLIEG
jgi:glycyl-tRNA synthetase beta chain